MAEGRLISFEHAPVLDQAARDFISSGSGVNSTIVLGPVESGKSTLGIALYYTMGCCIPRCIDGIRRARILIVRTTEGELDRGIKKSILNWFPAATFGDFKGSMPSVQMIRQFDMELEVELFAFEDDSEKVLKKLRSTEYTMAFVNEAQFMSQRLIKAIEQRTGRFPSAEMCPEYDRKRRLYADMNMPTSDAHFVLRMSGKSALPADMPPEERLQYKIPRGWKIYTQPPAVFALKDARGNISGFEVNPECENLFYSTEEGILALTEGADVDDVRRDMMNEVVPLKTGVARYKDLSMKWHVSRTRLETYAESPIICGHDPGLYGGWVFLQKINQQWRCIGEYKAANQVASEQADDVKEYLSLHFPWWQEAGFIGHGDPFGSRAAAGASQDERTVYDILRNKGLMFTTPALKDNPEVRLNTGRTVLKASIGNGVPKVVFDGQMCPMIIAALNGGMTMKRVGNGKNGEVKLAVDKANGHADIGESWEYAMWGGGEATELITGQAHGGQAGTGNYLNNQSRNLQSSPRKLFGRRG